MIKIKDALRWLYSVLSFIGVIFTIFDINSIFQRISWSFQIAVTGNLLRIAVGAILLAVFVLSFLGYISKLRFGPILWMDLTHKLNHIGSVPHKLTLVSHFQLKGKNRKSKKITVVDSYIQSLVSGEKIMARIDGKEAKNIIIEPKSYFTVTCLFPNDGGSLAGNSISGMTLESFRSKFSYFVFKFNTNRKRYEFKTEIDEVDNWIKTILLMNFPSPGERKHVYSAD